MQPRLKRFTLPALIALITLFTGVAATTELRSYPHVMSGHHMAFDAPSFLPSSFVQPAGAAVTTPAPLSGASPALHAATTFTVEVRANSTFSPASITIAPGDTIVWQRTGGFHNVVADDGSFRLGEGAAGNVGGSWTTVSHTFNTAGVFRYFCEAHGGSGGVGMSGVVIVQTAGATPTPTATATFPVPSPTATATATIVGTAPTATATLVPTATGTVVAPGQRKIYLPLIAKP